MPSKRPHLTVDVLIYFVLRIKLKEYFMNIAIDGTSGSGKGTLAQNIVERLSMDGPYSGGFILRTMAKEAGMTLEEFQKIARKDPRFDVEIDRRMRAYSLKKDNTVFDGRLTAFFCHCQVRIYLDCPLAVRAQRIVKRDKTTLEEAMQNLAFRDKNNAERYKKYYGITIGDPSQYNIFLNSEHASPKELADTVIKQITEHPERFKTFKDRDVTLISS